MAVSRNEIKFTKSLQDKKTREEHKLFVVEGVKLVTELLTQPEFEIEALYATPDFDMPVGSRLDPVRVSESELIRMSGLVTPNKVLAVVKYPGHGDKTYLHEKCILVLDEIKDPGNLGTILRTADWFGIRYVLASAGSVDIYNPKVIQASMGALFRISYRCLELESELTELKKNGFTISGADLSGENLFAYQFPQKTVIVMGSESHGISENLQKLLTNKVTIPKFGSSESLNVAMASGIILSEYRKQVKT